MDYAKDSEDMKNLIAEQAFMDSALSAKKKSNYRDKHISLDTEEALEALACVDAAEGEGLNNIINDTIEDVSGRLKVLLRMALSGCNDMREEKRTECKGCEESNEFGQCKLIGA